MVVDNVLKVYKNNLDLNELTEEELKVYETIEKCLTKKRLKKVEIEEMGEECYNTLKKIRNCKYSRDFYNKLTDEEKKIKMEKDKIKRRERNKIVVNDNGIIRVFYNKPEFNNYISNMKGKVVNV